MNCFRPISDDKELANFVVFYSLENLLKEYPHSKYEELEKDDIEGFLFKDLSQTEFLENKEIQIYLTRMFHGNHISKIKELLEINQVSFSEFLKITGFIETDPDNSQWLKKINDDLFYVLNLDNFHEINVSSYSDDYLNELSLSFFDGGLKEIKETHKDNYKQVLAEIIAES